MTPDLVGGGGAAHGPQCYALFIFMLEYKMLSNLLFFSFDAHILKLPLWC